MKNNFKRKKQYIKCIPYDEVLNFLKWQFDEDFVDQQINLFHVVKGIKPQEKRGIMKNEKIKKTSKKVNLAKAFSNNSHCLGYIYQFSNGKCTYQNDNDLGLDLDDLNETIEYEEKIFIYKRFYAYYFIGDAEDDGTGVDLELAKVLLKECHDNFIPMTEEEKKMCKDYWGQF